MADTAPKFSFQYLDLKNFPSLEGKDTQELFLKWGLQGRIKAQSYSFDQYFQAYQKDDFVQAFFSDPNVTSTLQVVSSSGKLVPIGVTAKSTTAEQIACSATSMSFFDRLWDKEIVRENGNIVKCFDEFVDDFTVSDELRKCLLMEESESYEIFSDGDRDELLFKLFTHLCLGGAVCQYEDDIQPYIDTAKNIYKDLVSVQKDPSTGKILVSSIVLKVTASDDSGEFYPTDEPHPQSFAYLIIDPLKRQATVFYHKHGSLF